MKKEVMNETRFLLYDIGKELEESKGKEISNDSLIGNLRRQCDLLIKSLKNDSIVEARTEYYSMLLSLAQIGFRESLAEKRKGLIYKTDSALETLKESVEILYDVAERSPKNIEEAINKLDSVILDMEVNLDV